MRNTKYLALALLAALALSGCTQVQSGSGTVSATLSVYDQSGNNVLDKNITGNAGESALEAISGSGVQMETQQYSVGAFVKSIAGVSPDSNHYLAIYVDGNYSNVGVSDIKLRQGMAITFRAERIEPPS